VPVIYSQCYGLGPSSIKNRQLYTSGYFESIDDGLSRTESLNSLYRLPFFASVPSRPRARAAKRDSRAGQPGLSRNRAERVPPDAERMPWLFRKPKTGKADSVSIYPDDRVMKRLVRHRYMNGAAPHHISTLSIPDRLEQAFGADRHRLATSCYSPRGTIPCPRYFPLNPLYALLTRDQGAVPPAVSSTSCPSFTGMRSPGL